MKLNTFGLNSFALQTLTALPMQFLMLLFTLYVFVSNQFKLCTASKAEKTGGRKFLFRKKETEINYHVCRHFTMNDVTSHIHVLTLACGWVSKPLWNKQNEIIWNQAIKDGLLRENLDLSLSALFSYLSDSMTLNSWKVPNVLLLSMWSKNISAFLNIKKREQNAQTQQQRRA